MKQISLMILALTIALAGISGQERGKEKAQEKRDQAKEKRDEAKDKAHEKRDGAKDKAKDKKGRAKSIAAIQKKIVKLKEVAARLDEKGNTEAAAKVRKAIEKAEMKLKEKQKARGISDADVKAAETAEGDPK